MRSLSVALLLASLLLAGCTGDVAPPAGEAARDGDALADVHGIAVDPQDPTRLLVATHFGLFAGGEGEPWTRVGDVQHDLMGFVVDHESGRFWASGHPRTGGNLGVIRSDDGGITWTSGGLDGVDFHAMTLSPADADSLWGVYRGDLVRTSDGGERWIRVTAGLPAMRALAAHPTQPETLYASTGTSVYRSDDGGVSWLERSSIAVHGLAVDPQDGQVLYGAAPDGVHVSRDGGATWTRLAWEGADRPGYVAVDPRDPRTLYMASFETGIHRSTDGGATWSMLRAPRS